MKTLGTTHWFAAVTSFCLATSAGGARAGVDDLVPKPAKLTAASGVFRMTSQTAITPGPGAEVEARTLVGGLQTLTALKLRLTKGTQTDCVALELDRSLESDCGAEGYRLSVTPARVLIRAAAPAGLFYGGVTLRQLLPSEVAPTDGWQVPCVEIEDSPRFPWRGLLLDTARHFMPPEFVKKLVDVMALHKMNTLQLHLTDDQGWRLEIKKYPGLTKVGSIRKESPKHGNRDSGDGTPYGPFFYTQKQIRDLVAYAQTRHVTIVPEIEMPGHVLAALTAYPALSCTGGPFQLRTRWGVEADILCVGNDASLTFAEDVLNEVTKLFPSRFIHIGGDEAPRDRWKTCPKCQARMKANNLGTEAQLQTWLNARLEAFLGKKGRRMIGWDEILEGGLTPGAAVMSWRGSEGGLAAAAAGHDVVMSPTTHCYLDYAQAKGPREPEAIGGFVPIETVYSLEPVPATLPESNRKHILGAQGNIWSEYLWTPRDVEYFAFPRALALAEIAWSPAAGRDFNDFKRRLGPGLKRLDRLDVNYRHLD